LQAVEDVEQSQKMPAEHRFSAILLDLDGVITATRHLHVQAWTRAFNEFLASQGKRPFDPVSDYERYVDGKPRDDGIRTFLASRGIMLGAPVRDLGKKKTDYYLELLEKQGPHVFSDAIEALNRWREQGIPLAVVSSSRNCAQVLRQAGIADRFEVRVDGVVGRRLGLRGKPEPDYFLEASRRLCVEPSQSLMVEDAISGVEAGRRGGFGAVIGMDRSGQNSKLLLEHGADRVVSSLMALIEPTTRAAA
jgi:beta-phosphoglucomutase family hydrolase